MCFYPYPSLWPQWGKYSGTCHSRCSFLKSIGTEFQLSNSFRAASPAKGYVVVGLPLFIPSRSHFANIIIFSSFLLNCYLSQLATFNAKLLSIIGKSVCMFPFATASPKTGQLHPDAERTFQKHIFLFSSIRTIWLVLPLGRLCNSMPPSKGALAPAFLPYMEPPLRVLQL